MKKICLALCGSLGWTGLVSAQVMPPPPAESPVPPAALAAPQPQRVSLKDFVARLTSSDESLRVQRLEQAIGDAGLRGAEAVFEPFAFTSLERESMHVLNSAADAKQRGVNPGDVYDSQENRFKAGVMVKVDSGADLEFSYNASVIKNSLQALANAPSPENKGYLGLKVTQPLMRGYGGEVNRLGIRIADADRRVAGETVRQLTAQRVMESINQYLLVQRAEERVRLRIQARQVATVVDKEISLQHAGGLRSAAELTEAHASLALKNAQLAQAQQDLEEQINALQVFLSARDRTSGETLQRSLVLPEPVQAALTPAEEEQAQPRQGLNAVLVLRPEARISTLRVEREARKVDFAVDQARPELNMTLRYGKEDLSSANRALPAYLGGQVPYNSWMVGLTLKVGLFGDQKKSSDYDVAIHRRSQAQLAASAIQQRIANELHASQTVFDKAHQQMERQREIVQAQRSLLKIEEQLVREGRRSAIDVARKQQELLTAEETLVDVQTQATRASYLVAQTSGSLLSQLDLE
ncbi:TolC family protein [Sphaerotilus sp.]|uniref:TolC family protein n=1 Tax=Sphaerotilus sp. TaxID=2093942 RepID=UPI0034E2CA1D